MSLIITGSPGVGKHTLSEIISKKIKKKIFDINKFIIEQELYEKKDNFYEVDTTQVKKELKKKKILDAIIVGHLAPYVISKTEAKLVLVLRKNPYKLLSIYKKRKYSQTKIQENVGSEILGIIAYESIKKFGKKKTFQIDTSSNDRNKLAMKILKILKKEFEGDHVDWLKLLKEKKDYEKFFPY